MSCVMALNKILNTTAFRLSLVTVAAFIATSAALVGVIFPRANDLLTRQVLETIAAEAKGLREQFDAGGLPRLTSTLRDRTRNPGANLYFLKDRTGRKLAGNLSRVPPEVSPASPGGVFTYSRPVRGPGARLAPGISSDVDRRARPTPPGNATPGSDSGPAVKPAALEKRLAAGVIIAVAGGAVLVVGRDTEDQRQFANTVKWAMYSGFALLLLIGLGGGLLVSRHTLNRIEAVTRSSSRIMEGDLSQRIALNGSGDELDRLAYSLNAMLERIEQLMAGLREVSDNIAHDLKTPLNRLRNRAEAALRDKGNGDAYRDGLEGVIEQADELIKTFNALLSIARLEAGDRVHDMELVDLNGVARDVGELYEPAAEEKGFALQLSLGEDLYIHANRQLIGQAIANLIDNAIKYSAPAPAPASALASVRECSSQTGTQNPEKTQEPRRMIEVGVTRVGQSARIVIADRGPGIDDSDRNRALQRFVRLEASRSKPGSGLGLSLVSAVVRLHGGTIALEDNSPGLRVVITLPGAQTGKDGALDPDGNNLAASPTPRLVKQRSARLHAGHNTSLQA